MSDIFAESTDMVEVPNNAGALTTDTTNMMQMADFWAKSTLVPSAFQNKPANCFMALDLSYRLNLPVNMVMEGLYVVSGRPAWESKFLSAISNASGKFTRIYHTMTGTKGQDDWGCIAYFTELSTGKKLDGPEVTIQMAKDEGWYGKPGSKWKTMPEIMLRYRAASFLIKTTAPELMCGFQTRDEREDMINVTPAREKSAVESAWEAEHANDNP